MICPKLEEVRGRYGNVMEHASQVTNPAKMILDPIEENVEWEKTTRDFVFALHPRRSKLISKLNS